MDRKVYYVLILFLILLAIYAWTSENAGLIVGSVIAIVVLGSLLLQFSREWATRKITYFDEFDITVTNVFQGNKKDWSISDEKIKVNCLNKEVDAKRYYVLKHRKERYTSDAGSDGIFKYKRVTEIDHDDTLSVLYMEFDSEKDNNLAKEELLKTFNIDESKYRASGNKCILILENSFIFKDVQFKDSNFHFGSFKVNKKVLAVAVIVGIVLVAACFVMFSQQNKVAIPKDAVKAYEDSPFSQFQSDHVSLKSKNYDGSSYDRDAESEVSSIEVIKFEAGFRSEDLKINGTNNYDVSIQKALSDLFKNTPQIESSKLNDNTNSSSGVEGIIVFYDENHNVVASEYVPLNVTRNNDTYKISANRIDVNQTPVYSAYTLGGTYPNKFVNIGHSAEFHLILKSDASQSSPEYYCYDLVFPAKVQNDNNYGY